MIGRADGFQYAEDSALCSHFRCAFARFEMGSMRSRASQVFEQLLFVLPRELSGVGMAFVAVFFFSRVKNENIAAAIFLCISNDGEIA
jgi:hypothetical protein